MPDLANEKHEDTSDVQGILNGLVSRFSLQDDSLSVRDATALAAANDLISNQRPRRHSPREQDEKFVASAAGFIQQSQQLAGRGS